MSILGGLYSKKNTRIKIGMVIISKFNIVLNKYSEQKKVFFLLPIAFVK